MREVKAMSEGALKGGGRGRRARPHSWKVSSISIETEQAVSDIIAIE